MNTNALIFTNPISAPQRLERDELLTTSLRDSNYHLNYSEEYPLVLAPEAQVHSWCVHSHGKLVAHANLWPRQLLHTSGQKSFQVGLVGNVATHPHHRGNGHMKALLSHLAKIAETQNIHVLVLWSDLLEFYQNFGFRSIGRELRLKITRLPLKKPTEMKSCTVDSLDDHQLEWLLQTRPKIEWTLGRSLKDFRALLKIPETHLFIRKSGQSIRSWVVIGRGADMKGVIHEWGALSASELLDDIQTILLSLDINELLLLCPGNLAHQWITALKRGAAAITNHPMALALSVTDRADECVSALSRGFIWGLDSI
jgi:N-acetylglutamate synthase-like GNAT family acetyltransferase